MARRRTHQRWSARLAGIPESGGPALAGLAVAGMFLALSVAGAIVAWRAIGWDPTRIGGDAWNYLAAGERLNSGHDLYALGPGDRPVPLLPPYWSAPLLAPPPIAVAWRPLAILGDPAMALWGIACLVAAIAAVGALARGGRIAYAPVALLAAPVAFTALSGNFGALQLAGLVLLWTWRERPALAGTILATLLAVKLTPIVLAAWLLATRRFRALLFMGAAGGLILALSVAGAGIDAWVDWFEVARSSAPAPRALATVTGLSMLAVLLVMLAITAGVGVLGRDRLTFAVAVVAASLATPALYPETLGPTAALGAGWMLLRGRSGQAPVGTSADRASAAPTQTGNATTSATGAAKARASTARGAATAAGRATTSRTPAP